ncbi:hypothetical protein GQ42DRAFT_178019 [Ramicandelaber brevisporus]|nr:hypothetical protein GQ42DRAFT_178019 [Ramicandelaber brevisporus]
MDHININNSSEHHSMLHHFEPASSAATLATINDMQQSAAGATMHDLLLHHEECHTMPEHEEADEDGVVYYPENNINGGGIFGNDCGLMDIETMVTELAYNTHPSSPSKGIDLMAWRNTADTPMFPPHATAADIYDEGVMNSVVPSRKLSPNNLTCSSPDELNINGSYSTSTNNNNNNTNAYLSNATVDLFAATNLNSSANGGGSRMGDLFGDLPEISLDGLAGLLDIPFHYNDNSQTQINTQTHTNVASGATSESDEPLAQSTRNNNDSGNESTSNAQLFDSLGLGIPSLALPTPPSSTSLHGDRNAVPVRRAATTATDSQWPGPATPITLDDISDSLKRTNAQAFSAATAASVKSALASPVKPSASVSAVPLTNNKSSAALSNSNNGKSAIASKSATATPSKAINSKANSIVVRSAAIGAHEVASRLVNSKLGSNNSNSSSSIQSIAVIGSKRPTSSALACSPSSPAPSLKKVVRDGVVTKGFAASTPVSPVKHEFAAPTSTIASSVAKRKSSLINNNELAFINMTSGDDATSTALARLMPSNEVLDKPYRCSMPGCNKVYSSIGGLKYHSERGHQTEHDANVAAAFGLTETVSMPIQRASTTSGIFSDGEDYSIPAEILAALDDPSIVSAVAAKAHLTNPVTPEQIIALDERAKAEAAKKPIICHIDGCEKRYSNKNGLRYHVKMHHPEYATSPVDSDYPGFASSSSSGESTAANSNSSRPSKVTGSGLDALKLTTVGVGAGAGANSSLSSKPTLGSSSGTGGAAAAKIMRPGLPAGSSQLNPTIAPGLSAQAKARAATSVAAGGKPAPVIAPGLSQKAATAGTTAPRAPSRLGSGATTPRPPAATGTAAPVIRPGLATPPTLAPGIPRSSLPARPTAAAAAAAAATSNGVAARPPVPGARPMPGKPGVAIKAGPPLRPGLAPTPGRATPQPGKGNPRGAGRPSATAAAATAPATASTSADATPSLSATSGPSAAAISGRMQMTGPLAEVIKKLKVPVNASGQIDMAAVTSALLSQSNLSGAGGISSAALAALAANKRPPGATTSTSASTAGTTVSASNASSTSPSPRPSTPISGSAPGAASGSGSGTPVRTSVSRAGSVHVARSLSKTPAASTSATASASPAEPATASPNSKDASSATKQ